MDTNRQKRINKLLFEELSIIFQQQSAQNKGILISVTEVNISPDLSLAKVYVSIFPQNYRKNIIEEIRILKPKFRKLLGDKLSKNIRIIPELIFHLDNTLDVVQEVENALKKKDNNFFKNK